MRRLLLFCLAAALLTGFGALSGPAFADGANVYVLSHGTVTVRHDPLAGPPDPYRPTAADNAAAATPDLAPPAAPGTATAARRMTVTTSLKGMYARKGIDKAHYEKYTQDYRDAKAALKRLSGRRHVELAAVYNNLNAVAASGKLTTPRAAMAFLTLRRNVSWWTKGRLLSYGERVEFGSSIIQWQSYPGQGLQLQWLGTFGKVNALWQGGPRYDKKLRTLLGEILPLAAKRAGGIAWEYWFHFGGGNPLWVSGMAQGTAIQGLSRAASRLNHKTYVTWAKRALGIFRTAPPTGVRDVTGKGRAHYLIYSFSHEHVLNAFIQSLNGLHDYAVYTGDASALRLFKDGTAEARLEVPRYDTGAWSLYQPGEESPLSYHELLRDFLVNLCDRLSDDRKKAKKDGHAVSAWPNPVRYCTAATHFTSYLKQKPKVAVRALTGGRVGRNALVRVGLSKISSVTMTVTRGGSVASQRSLQFGYGKHTLSWGPVAKKGRVIVTVRATDLNGNVGSSSTTQTIR